MNKAISTLLAVVLLLGVVAVGVPEDGIRLGLTAFAASSGTCGANLTWVLDDEGVLTISGTGAMYDFEAEAMDEFYYFEHNYAPWIPMREEINSIIIGNGVTSIGDFAFYSCSLTDVSIGASVERIGKLAFGACSGLRGVTIPDSVIRIEEGAFLQCWSMTGIIIGNSVEYIGSKAFSGNGRLSSVTIPASVTDIEGNVFVFTNPARITVDEANTHYCDIDGVLFNYDKTELISYPYNSETEYSVPQGVTSIGDHAFQYCNVLTDIILPDTLVSVGDFAFTDCVNLERINIPGNVTVIGDSAFASCGLKSITLAESVRSIGKNAFSWCSELTDVVIPAGVTGIGDSAFSGCCELDAIVVDEANTHYCDVDGVLFSADMTDLICYPRGRKGKYSVPNGVANIGMDAFICCDGLTGVTLPDSLISIGDFAFDECSGLTNVTIPNNVTSIGRHAFSWCDGLTGVVIPAGVAELGDGVFFGCPYLEAIAVDKANTHYRDVDGVLFSADMTDLICYPCGKEGRYAIPDGVVNIGKHAFFCCSGLTDIAIPDSVVSIEDFAFDGCSGLTGIAIPDNVVRIGFSAFSSCEALTSITIPHSVTKIKYGTFDSCHSLTSVTIPDSVTGIQSSAFSGCTALSDVYYTGTEAEWQNINIGLDNEPLFSAGIHYNYTPPFTGGTCGENLTWTLDDEGVLTISGTGAMDNWTWAPYQPWYSFRASVNTIVISSGVTSIDDYAFSGCSSLTGITIPDSVTSIGADAFLDCSSLTGITIPDSVTSVGDRAFLECSSLTDITIPVGVTSIGDSTFFNCSSLTGITIPDSVTSIGNNAFDLCSSLADITIPDGVISIGESAFSWCSSLTDITIPDSVASIGLAPFRSCTNLASINVSDMNTSYCDLDGVLYTADMTELIAYPISKLCEEYTIPDGVTSICDWAFSECSSLTGITIPDSVTSIGEGVFGSCCGLTDMTIPNGVTSIYEFAFSECSGLTDITIPDSVTSIYNFAFSRCSSLTDITIPDGVTRIGDYAFAWCSSLTDITIPDSVTEIGVGLFAYNTSLSSINVSDMNTSYCDLDGVWYSADMTELKAYPIGKLCEEYTIPDSVISIDDFAFGGCISLTGITIPYSVTHIGEGAFADCSSLTDVYYAGTEKDWAQINIDYDYNGNDSLLYATIHFTALADQTTGVSISKPADETNITDTTRLVVAAPDASDVDGDVIAALNEAGEYTLFDISLKETDGSAVQPSCAVTVLLPIPAGYDPTDCKVYYVAEDGSKTDMNARIVGNYLVFDTTHFSYYAIVQAADRLPGDVNNDGQVTMLDSTVLRRYLAGWSGVTITAENADVNGDGEVTMLDSTVLRRYLANWSGVELK